MEILSFFVVADNYIIKSGNLRNGKTIFFEYFRISSYCERRRGLSGCEK
jgi:hypothetical protein